VRETAETPGKACLLAENIKEKSVGHCRVGKKKGRGARSDEKEEGNYSEVTTKERIFWYTGPVGGRFPYSNFEKGEGGLKSSRSAG